MASSDPTVPDTSVSSERAPKTPRRRLAVVTCIDARVDPWRIIGASAGDVHTIRNAGAVVTDDVIRSLTISNRAAGVNQVHLIMHTDCAVHGLDEAQVAARAGAQLPFPLRAFDDLEAELRRGVDALRTEPLLDLPGGVTGSIYDVETGTLTSVV